MKATIEVPNDLYRRVKAKSALEGRAVRDVTIELYQRYVEQEETASPKAGKDAIVEDETTPRWFGILGKTARAVTGHEMSAIRESIARGVTLDRDL